MLRIKDEFPTGSIIKNKSGLEFVVTCYPTNSQALVVFLESGYSTRVQTNKLKTGSIKDRLHKSIRGVATIGDGIFNSTDKFYLCWKNMIERCYISSKSCGHGTYTDVTVDDSWLNFQIFAMWCHLTYPYNRAMGEFSLDKDLLGDGTLYSPDSCCWLPPEINGSLSKGKRGKYLQGVIYDKDRGKFRSKIGSKSSGGLVYGGSYDLELDAHNCYLNMKTAHLRSLATKYESVLSKLAYEKLSVYTYTLNN